MLTRLTLLLLLLYALPGHLWPGLLGGAGLFWLLWRSPYRDSFLWFASLPGLYHFWGVSLQAPTLAEAFSDWGLTTLGLLLWGVAARQDRWAVLWLGPLVALRLDGIAVALWVLAHAVHTLERDRIRSEEMGRPLYWSRTALLGAVGLLGLLTLALIALPLRVSLGMDASPIPNTPVQPSPLVLEPGSSPTGQPRPQIIPAEPTPFARFAEQASQALLPIILGLMALILSLLGLASLRAPPSKLRPRGVHLIPLIAAGFFWAMLIAWLGTQQHTPVTQSLAPSAPTVSSAAPEGEAPALPPPIRRGTDWVYALGLGMALLATAALLLVAVALLRSLRESAREMGVTPATGGGPPRSESPSSRIRRAYQRFLQQMGRRGFPRTPFESPRAYAARLGKLNPRAQVELQKLTELYEPVRYGGLGDESRAEQAEALAEALPASFSEQEGRA